MICKLQKTDIGERPFPNALTQFRVKFVLYMQESNFYFTSSLHNPKLVIIYPFRCFTLEMGNHLNRVNCGPDQNRFVYLSGLTTELQHDGIPGPQSKITVINIGGKTYEVGYHLVQVNL